MLKFWSDFGEDWERAKYLIWGLNISDEDWHKETAKELFGEFLMGVKLREDWTILDYGCGVGRIMKLIAPHVKLAIGVDISHDMIKMAKKYLEVVPNVEVYETNGVDLSIFPDCKFDFVFEKSVFQHIPDTRITIGILKEIARVLKPKGIARLNFLRPTRVRLATRPSVHNFRNFLNFVKRYLMKEDDWSTTWKGEECSFKGNSYSKTSLRKMLDVSGLSLLNLETYQTNPETYQTNPKWWWTTSTPAKKARP
jgi:ubiquinone/menaquinone biosynthesis C-methylase UbiE